MISTNDVRAGMALNLPDGLFQVVDHQHTKPGKGKAFVKMKLRNLDTGAVAERTFRAGENVQDAKIDRRELVLRRSRQVVQHSARAIRAVHRCEWPEAESIAAEARSLLSAMHEAAEGHADLQSAGYMLDAQKEYAEACLTLALVRGADLPSPDSLGVDDAAWLNGL